MAHAQRRRGQVRKIAGHRDKFRYSNGDWKRSIARFHERSVDQGAGRTLQPQSLSSAEWVESLRSLNLHDHRFLGEDVLLVVRSDSGPDRIMPLSEIARRAGVVREGAAQSGGRTAEKEDPEGEPGIGDAIGPFYRAGNLVELLDISKDELERRSEAGELLRLQTSDHVDVWPAMQFDETHRPPAGLDRVLAALRVLFRDYDGWASAFWLAAPSAASDPTSPARMDLLRSDGPEAMLQRISRMQVDRNETEVGEPRKDDTVLRDVLLDVLAELTEALDGDAGSTGASGTSRARSYEW